MDWLREKRLEKNASQHEVAKKIGVTQPTYSNIETGKRKPSPRTAKGIGEFLGFDWTMFFDNTNY